MKRTMTILTALMLIPAIALAATVLRAEGYGSGLVYLNKVESAEDWRNAEAFAALLPAAVAAGSLWKGTYRTLRE